MSDYDYEREMALRERRMMDAEYERGRREVEEIQAFTAPGSAEREAMYREMEQAAYDRGEE